MSINAKVKQIAKITGRPIQQIHREFYMLRFLARVFSDPDSPWVLKGGSGLLVRIDGARHSRDVDLMRIDVDAGQALLDLQRICDGHTDLDPFTFEVKRNRRDTGARDVAQLDAIAYYGAAELHSFPIDLSIRTLLAAEVDHVVPTTVIAIDEIAALPPFRCLSLADQVADKVSAMYERYGATETPSTRYHDLVDLLLIIGRFPLDATKTLRALHIQQQRRPRLTLPTAVTAPGPEWARGYRAEARGTSLAPELQHLDAALATLAACLDPLLDGAMPVGTWNPATRHWDNSPAEA